MALTSRSSNRARLVVSDTSTVYFQGASTALSIGCLAGNQLASLQKAIRQDKALAELAQTPLMLSIMSLAYQGASGDEFARQKGDSAEERRKQIFGLYVERMFQRRGTTPHAFPKEKTIGWLSWLARKMR